MTGPCKRCERPLRARSQTLDDNPGTVVHRSQGYCYGCWRRVQLGLPGPVGLGRHMPQVWTVDHAAVELATQGQVVYLRPGDRAVAVKQLTARGYSARTIAAMLRCTPRTVTRIRNRHTRLQDAA